MSKSTIVLCNGASSRLPKSGLDREPLSLSTSISSGNVHLSLDNLSKKMFANPPAMLIDLIEIASCIYAADQAISRGVPTAPQNGANRSRNFQFHFAVRNPQLWKQPGIKDILIRALSFLSADRFELNFQKNANPEPMQSYLKFGDYDVMREVQQVSLFSGGADSLAWTAKEIFESKRPLALVSHWAASTVLHRQKELFHELLERAEATAKPFHIPVRVCKDADLSNDRTLRTRSFLFISLAITVAYMLKINTVIVPENGIVNINLPISRAVAGNYATRSTHPKTLLLLEEFFSLLLDRQIKIHNPLAGNTKAEVMRVLKDSGQPDLLLKSSSCANVMFQRTDAPHCGICSQCVDRRFATVATDLEQFDPKNTYKIDIFEDDLPDTTKGSLPINYVRMMQAIDRMDEARFELEYHELAEFYSMNSERPDELFRSAFELHKRQASTVLDVLKKMIARSIGKFASGLLPNRHLLHITSNSQSDLNSYPVISEDYGYVKCVLGEFHFTGKQAEAVRVMHQAQLSGQASVNQNKVLSEAGSESKRLSDLFRRHEAFGKLIVKAKRGTYKLNFGN